MDEKKIRRAFKKVKQDLGFLSQKIDFLSEILAKINEKIEKIEKNSKSEQKEISTKKAQNQAYPQKTSTHPYQFKPLKPQNLPISTGNQGVSTDRQTDRHINRHPFISYEKTDFLAKNSENHAKAGNLEDPAENQHNSVDEAAQLLDSLDNIKRELRLKFKRLTNQEMLIFSAIYQIEQEQGHADYKILAGKLALTESSIRDYVGRIIKKGIPVEKTKIKNKNIQLNISPNLKRLASLSTILQLRDL